MARNLIFRVGSGGKWHILIYKECLYESYSLKTCSRFSNVNIVSGEIQVGLRGRQRVAETRWLEPEDLNKWGDQGRMCEICRSGGYSHAVDQAIAEKLGMMVPFVRSLSVSHKLAFCPICRTMEESSPVYTIKSGDMAISACRKCLDLVMKLANSVDSGATATIAFVNLEKT